MTEAAGSLSRDADQFIAYIFGTYAMRGSLSDRFAPGKRQEMNYYPVVPVLAPAVDVKWPFYVTGKIIYDVRRGYWRYHGVVDDYGYLLADNTVEIRDDLPDIIMQQSHWLAGGGHSFTERGCSMIFLEFEQLSKTVPTSGSEFADIVRSLVDDIEITCTAATKAEKDIDRNKVLLSIVSKSASDVLNEVASCESESLLQVTLTQSC